MVKDLKKQKNFAIYKKLVRNECCNFIQQKCVRKNFGDCNIMNNENCKFFDEVVKPLIMLKDEYKKNKKFVEVYYE